MGSVRRMLPRVVLLGTAATGVVLLLATQGAGAQDAPEPGPVGTVSGAVDSLLPPPAADPPAGDPTTPPVTLPDLSAAPSVLGPPAQAVTDATTPVLGSAPDLVPSLLPTAVPTTAAALASPGAVPTVAAPSLDSSATASLPASPVPDPATITDPLAAPRLFDLTAGRTAGRDTVPLAGPDLDDLDVPALLPALPGGADVPAPLPSPEPHPTEPTGAFLRPATPPPPTTSRGSAPTTGPTSTRPDPPDQTLEFVLAAIQHAGADSDGGANPARGPPDDLPRDPTHRGSSDHLSHDFSLPGTDRIGVTRGERWHAGTDVELSNTPPEPSVSPD